MLKFLLIFLSIQMGFLSLSQNDVDRMVVDYNTYHNLSTKAQQKNLDSAEIYVDSCIAIGQNLRNESDYYIGKAFQLKARGEFYQGEIDSSIIYGNQSIDILSGYPDSLDYFVAEYNQGNLYLFQDDNIQALIQFRAASRIIEENFEMYMSIDPDKLNLNRAYCSLSIGIVYENLGDYDNALNRFKKAIKISYKVESWESEVLRSIVLGNLGSVYYELGDYQLAESYAIASMEQKKKLGQDNSLGYGYQVLAKTAHGRKKYGLCLKYLDQADKKFEVLKNQTELDRNSFWKAKCYLGQTKIDQALTLLLSIEESFHNIFSKNEQADFYELLSDVYLQAKDYKRANDYLRITLLIRKELDAKNDKKIINQFIEFFENEEVQLNHKIENLKHIQEREKLELQIESDNEKKVWIYSLFLVSIVCLILIIIVIANAYRRIKKTTAELSESIEENKILFREVHHRVKNNFQIISSLLNLQHGIEEDERGKKVLTDAQGRIQSMSLVHEMLYRKNEVKRIGFKLYAEELVASIFKSFTDNDGMIKYSVNAKDETFDLEIAVPLGLILNEAITNSVKYAFNELGRGQIDISLDCDNKENNVLVISDNGVGIEDEYINGSKETLGIELINILSEQLGGKAVFSNKSGTELTIYFKS